MPLSKNKHTGLYVADIHMSNRLPYAVPTANGLTDRLEDQLRLWESIKGAASKYDVDGIYILGDLLDKAVVDPVTLTEVTKALMGLPKPTYFLPGNHDAASLIGGRYAVEAFGEMREDFVVVGMDESPIAARDWLNFWPIAFMPAAETMERLKKINDTMDGDITNVLLFHNSIVGATHLGWKCDDGMGADEVLGGFDWALCGHFHDHQEFGDGRGMYLGAPMHHHYGDVGREAGYWVITFDDDGERTDEYIDPGLPRFHVFSDVESYAMGAKKGDYVRLELSATHADWAKIRPKAQEATQNLRAQGIRADYKHIPVYHHKTRLKTVEHEDARLDWDHAISQYVDATDVVKGDLDCKKLKDLGRNILADIRSRHGSV